MQHCVFVESSGTAGAGVGQRVGGERCTCPTPHVGVGERAIPSVGERAVISVELSLRKEGSPIDYYKRAGWDGVFPQRRNSLAIEPIP
jgi:hypothetical protein